MSIVFPPTEIGTPYALRVLMHQKLQASYRHRTAIARRLKVSGSEIAALAFLAEGSLTPRDLGRRLQLTSGGMTALLVRMTRRGHILRTPHLRDKRSVVISAVVEVLEEIGELYAPLVAEADAVAESIAPREREMLHRYLSMILDVTERHAEMLVMGDVPVQLVTEDDDHLHLWA